MRDIGEMLFSRDARGEIYRRLNWLRYEDLWNWATNVSTVGKVEFSEQQQRILHARRGWHCVNGANGFL
jgi:hypothetical protein